MEQLATQQTQKKIKIEIENHLLYIKNLELNKTLRYDLKKLELQKQLKNGEWIKTSRQYHFFYGCSMKDIECNEQKFYDLINTIEGIYVDCRSLATFIERLGSCIAYETYCQAGIKAEGYVRRSTSRYGRQTEILTKPLNFYSAPIRKLFKEYDITVTKDLEDLFIASYALLEQIALLNINSETKRKFFKTIEENHGRILDKIKILTETYKYDLKSLVEYLLNYLDPFENLEISESLDLLVDYIRMATQIHRSVKKYPKYLHSMHDIITANYNVFSKEYDEQLFKQIVNPNLEYVDKDFCMINPITSKDIVKEGTDLNHCVSSYIDRILRLETYIMFLRKSSDKEKSLVTVEYNNGEIVTAKGAYNREVTNEERNFLEKYGKIKNIPIRI